MITHIAEGVRRWPAVSADLKRVLDVGCGLGDALARCGLSYEGLAVGIDVNFDELKIGRKKFPQVQLCCASGEAIPFKDAVFDAVLSRVALPYMDIPKAVAEIARVLRPGGAIWLVLHRADFVLSGVAESVRNRKMKGLFFRFYVLANGMLLHLAGRNFRFPLNRMRCESFQTESSIRRLLLQAGFEEIKVLERRPFIVTATLPKPIETTQFRADNKKGFCAGI